MENISSFRKYLLEMFTGLAAILTLHCSYNVYKELTLIGKKGTEPLVTEYSLWMGVIAPVSAIMEAGKYFGYISGWFILLAPFVAAVIYYDAKRKLASFFLFAGVIGSASMIITGHPFNLLVGLGGLIALPVIVIFALFALLNKEKEIKEDKHLKEFENLLRK